MQNLKGRKYNKLHKGNKLMLSYAIEITNQLINNNCSSQS